MFVFLGFVASKSAFEVGWLEFASAFFANYYLLLHSSLIRFSRRFAVLFVVGNLDDRVRSVHLLFLFFLPLLQQSLQLATGGHEVEVSTRDRTHEGGLLFLGHKVGQLVSFGVFYHFLINSM